MKETTAVDSARELSLEDAAALTSGASFWTTKSIGDATSLTLTDGPHGVRKQHDAADHLGISPSEPATCVPPAVSLAQSWDPELVRRVGSLLGREARSREVGVLLGPGINIKRDPRGGRNFEYLSEDPFLTATLAEAWVDGVQSHGVGASLKHFAVNNAEDDRMRASSDVDPRTLREIYLRAFQRVVQRARPQTVMCSYNRINGVFAAENAWLLTTVLRKEWGFEGAVVSDWGAVRDRVASIAAGLDLAMPGPDPAGDAAIVRAVSEGILDADTVRASAARVVDLARDAATAHTSSPADEDDHHDLAREAASRCIVLLKNDSDLLPLAKTSSVAVIGEFAEAPRFQGGGSSHVVPTRLDIPVDEIRSVSRGAVTYSPGFRIGPTEDAEALRADAVDAARRADAAILFLGLPDAAESEGFDRPDIELPEDQRALVDAVAAVQPRTVVVLAHGGVVRLSGIDATVPAILDGGLLGQGGGHAIASTIYGDVAPSGRLSETVPVRLEDVPAYLNFTPVDAHAPYGEGIFVGYRWYDARKMTVSYPFGHGLTYTTFEYSDLVVTAGDDDEILVEVNVTNTGARTGREVVQVYSAHLDPSVPRPVRELAGYGSVVLEPGETTRASIRVETADLAYWETRTDGWRVQPGRYRIDVGSSSRHIRDSAEVEVRGAETRIPLTLDSTIGELMADPAAAVEFGDMLGMFGTDDTAGETLGMDMAKMIGSMPISKLAAFSGGSLDEEALLASLARVNAGSAAEPVA